MVVDSIWRYCNNHWKPYGNTLINLRIPWNTVTTAKYRQILGIVNRNRFYSQYRMKHGVFDSIWVSKNQTQNTIKYYMETSLYTMSACQRYSHRFTINSKLINMLWSLIPVCQEISDNDLTIFAIICFTFACCQPPYASHLHVVIGTRLIWYLLLTRKLVAYVHVRLKFENGRFRLQLLSYLVLRHGHNLTSTISFLLHWAKGKFVALTVKFKLNYTCWLFWYLLEHICIFPYERYFHISSKIAENLPGMNRRELSDHTKLLFKS